MTSSARRPLQPATETVVLGRPPHDPGSPVSPPLQLTSTFVSRARIPDGSGNPAYGRPDNATVTDFESVVAALEGGAHALAFASGMAAISAVISLAEGGRVIAPQIAYNTTVELLASMATQGRIELVQVDITAPDEVAAALQAGTDLLWLESPTNPLLQVADLAQLVGLARAAGARTVVDNTFATPLLQQPLSLGADVVVHSATKFIAGHSDVVLGVAVTNSEELAAGLATERRMRGGIAGPFEAWLALRGLRTLDVRLRRQLENAQLLAERLSVHPGVSRVYYPGLPSDPGHSLAAHQMSGFGAIIAVDLDGEADAVDRVVAACRLWVSATSLGGVESLLERRRRIASEPAVVPENFVRLSVGIEAVEDLWVDLEQALTHL